jgi:hypothetical protein
MTRTVSWRSSEEPMRRFDRVPAEELVYMNSDFSSPSSPSPELYLNINPSRISTPPEYQLPYPTPS